MDKNKKTKNVKSKQVYKKGSHKNDGKPFVQCKTNWAVNHGKK